MELSALIRKFVLHYDYVQVKVNRHNIGSLFNHKYRLPASLCSSIVCKLSCARCACECVGSTLRLFHTRISEHAGKSHRTDFLSSALSPSRDRMYTCQPCPLLGIECILVNLSPSGIGCILASPVPF